MNRFQRWLVKDFMYNLSDEAGGVMSHDRRATDKVTQEMLEKEAKNGENTKQLVVRYHFENKIELAKIRTTQWWHTKIIVGLLFLIISAFVTLAFFIIRNEMMFGG